MRRVIRRPPTTGPKILILDIETAPLLAYVWRIWDENIGLEQIFSDWHVLSWAAKWLHDPPEKIMYRDQRRVENIEDDREIMKELRDLVDQADFLLTHHGRQFDNKKINARFLAHGFQPPSAVRHLDTKIIAKRHFGFVSNKLAYLTEKLNKKYRKLDHIEFPGFKLWQQVLKGNARAWWVMEEYNKHDVLALEELYLTMAPWDTTNFTVYNSSEEIECKCGSTKYKRNGYYFTNQNRYQRYKCLRCGYEWRDSKKAVGKSVPVANCARG